MMMNIRKCAAVAALAVFGSMELSKATLADFVDYSLGGATSSWDYFYGGNYLPAFSFLTGGAGNPNTANDALTMSVVVPNWLPGQPFTPGNGQAMGPIDTATQNPGSDFGRFYTLFASPVNWSISATAVETVDSVVFQVRRSSASAVSVGMLLNGLEASESDYNTTTQVETYRWDSLALAPGSLFSLAWSNTAQHVALDAFQLQTDGQVVPEPSTWALLGIASVGILVWMRRRNSGSSLRSSQS